MIDKMPHLIKIHGGNMFGNWLSAAMALHRLEGLEERLKEAVQRSSTIFTSHNEIKGMKITAYKGGTNIYTMQLPPGINVQKLGEHLNSNYSIQFPRFNPNGETKITVNETLLYRDTKFIIDAIRDGIKKAGG